MRISDWSSDVCSSDLSRIRIWEPEIVFRANRDLPPRAEPYAYEEVALAVDAVPAIEFLAFRFDVNSMQEMADRPFEAYADNTLSGGFVVGEAVADWRSLDFSNMRHDARQGDKVVGEAVGGNPVATPFLLVFVGATRHECCHVVEK